MDFSTLQLRDATISARGAKSCQLVDSKNEKVHMNLGSKAEPLTTPFGATNFGGEETARRTLEFSLSQEQYEFRKSFDEWAVKYLFDNCTRFFKKKQTMDQIREQYKSPVSQKGDYRPMLRTKINVSGSGLCRCWDENDQRMDMPEDLRNYALVPKVQISHLWQMNKEFGWVINVQDLLCRGQPQISPFADE